MGLLAAFLLGWQWTFLLPAAHAQVKPMPRSEIIVLDAPPAQPQIIYNGPDGAVMSLSDYQGKVLLVNFWGSFCPPCTKELPALDRLKIETEDDSFEIIAISLDRDLPKAQLFFEGRNISHLTLWHDPNMESFKAADFDGVPMSIIYSETGQELFRIQGDVDWNSREGKELLSLIKRQHSRYKDL